MEFLIQAIENCLMEDKRDNWRIVALDTILGIAKMV